MRLHGGEPHEIATGHSFTHLETCPMFTPPAPDLATSRPLGTSEVRRHWAEKCEKLAVENAALQSQLAAMKAALASLKDKAINAIGYVGAANYADRQVEAIDTGEREYARATLTRGEVK